MERTIDAGSLAARTGYVPAPRPSHSRHGHFAALLGLLLATQAVGTTYAAEPEATEPRRAAAPAPSGPALLDLESLSTQAGVYARSLSAWYAATPPAERVTWGGLLAAAALGLGVIFERSIRLRPSRIVPGEFPTRFLERLQDGRLDRGKAQDYCELNPSPASRVALAAVRRWGRPVIDLDRAVGLAQRIEVERIRRHVGTLRRIAALAPLIGLLGTLTALSRALGGLGTGTTAAVWGPVLAAALWPVTAGVALATLALVAYDGLAGKVEQLSDHLDRIGAETIDAIALALPSSPATSVAPESRAATMLGPAQSHGPHTHAPGHGHGHGHSHPSLGSARSAGHIRMEIPRPAPRPHLDDDDDLD